MCYFMDSKPLAILIAIIITFGAMGVIAVFGGNLFSGTASNIELTPKSIEVIALNEDHLEVSILMTNQGTSTIHNVNATMEVKNYMYQLSSNPNNVESYKTLSLSGSLKDELHTAKSVIGDTVYPYVNNLPDSWNIYPGDDVWLHIHAESTSGDVIKKLYKITVK